MKVAFLALIICSCLGLANALTAAKSEPEKHILTKKPLAEISWQDSAFKECVQKTAQQNNWTDASEFTQLKCHNEKIESANELQYFIALEQLSLFGNRIRQLDLSALKKLKTLNLANNKLVKLNIAHLEKLDTLFLFKNELSTLNLSGLVSLSKVRLMQNNLTQLDISELVSLESGYFFDNQLEDLQITGLNKLRFLDVKQNPMPDELYDFYDKQEGIVISHDGNADDWD